MNKRTIRNIIFILITAVLSVFFLSRQPVYAAVTSTTYDAPENVRAVRYSNTSVRISWKADTNTDGYIIYRYDRSSKKYVQVKVIGNLSADN